MRLTRSATVFYPLTQHFFLYKWGNCCSDILGCTISVKILMHKYSNAYYIYGIVCTVYTYTHTIYGYTLFLCIFDKYTLPCIWHSHYYTSQKGQFQILTWFWDYQSNCMFFNKLKVLRRNHVEKFISPFHAFFKCLQSWSLHHSNKKKIQ